MTGSEEITTAPQGGYLRQPRQALYLGRIGTEPARASSLGLAAPLMLAGAFLTGYQSFRIGDVNVTLADLAFAGAFGLCAWRGQITARPFRGMTTLWLIGLVLTLTGLMISTLAYGDMLRWGIIAIQYLFGYLLLPMMLLNQPAELSKRIVLAFIAGMVLLEASGIIVSMTMDHSQASAIFDQEFLSGNGRMSSFAAEPNWNGQLIAMTFPLLLYSYSRRMISLRAFAVAAPILAWGLLLSASFTGFMATMIAVTITLLFLGIRQLAGALVVVAVAGSLFMVSGAPMPAVFEKRVGGAISEGNIEQAGTFTGRVELVRQAWEAADHTVFVGYGVEGFRKTNALSQPVHNLFLLMLVDGGVLSFLGLVIIAAALIWIPLSYKGGSRAGMGTALAVVAVFLIYTQSNPHMFSRLNINPVMFALILLYVGDKRATRKV